MIRLFALLLILFAATVQAATEPPAPIDAPPAVPAVAPATPSVQGGPITPPPSPKAALPEVELPQPPSISPAAVQKNPSSNES